MARHNASLALRLNKNAGPGGLAEQQEAEHA
jgi:hypothetical protein